MNERWKVVAAFVGVFAAGLICGVPLSRWIEMRHEGQHPPFVDRTMQRYEHDLGLTQDQKAKIRPILIRAQQEWRQLRQDHVRNLTRVIDRMHAEVAAELNPEQRAKLEKMRVELRARAERLRGRLHRPGGPDGGGGPPPPI